MLIFLFKLKLFKLMFEKLRKITFQIFSLAIIWTYPKSRTQGELTTSMWRHINILLIIVFSLEDVAYD